MEQIRRVIVIGSGPASYTAALYLARAELKPLVFAGEKWGGQLMLTTMVENYPGFAEGVMGPTLMGEMRKQAGRFGAEVMDKDVTKVDFSQKPLRVMTGEDEYQAEAVVIATGAESLLLGVPGEEEFMGRGVSTCAVCDAPLYKGKQQTYVVGGGDAAMEEALALSKYTNKVGLIHRRDKLKASKIMELRVRQEKKIEFLWNTEVLEIIGDDKLKAIKVKNNKTGEVSELVLDGLFIAIGHVPATQVFRGQVGLDEKGYIKTEINYPSKPSWLSGYPTMTSVEGVFAAGDVVDFRYRQAVTAAGFGCMAALDVEKYLTGTMSEW